MVLRVKRALLLCEFTQNYNMSTNFTETNQYQISLTSVQSISNCYKRKDGQTDIMKPIGAILELVIANTSKLALKILKS